ncbi:MAG TPA: peptidoglycan editing factor PgeF [Alphaproteobacteria bacterium]|nr:peptidoglycan editing factor PgeF [Alphaproteobacteria bacterium]
MTSTPVAPLESAALAALPGLRHGFFTRKGGVSRAGYASLNCGLGSADDARAVAENRRRAAAAFGLSGDALVTAHQVHSARVAVIEAPWPLDNRPRLDGIVTRCPGLALGVLAADCAPLLFADPDARVVGAAHAGWRGALGGVAEATIEAMVAQGAKRAAIRAAIGPCIAQASYEVGPEFPALFLAEDEASAAFFKAAPRNGHFHFDLPGYLEARLRRLGLAAIDRLSHDTYAEPDLFFSYRRATHAGETDYGRGLSAIALV